MNTFQNQYKEPLEKAVLMHSCLSMYLFSECVHSLRALMFFMLCGIISFANANGFYSVYALRYSLYSVCVSQRFLFCLSLYMFSEWHLVPQLCIQIKQSRVYSRKALAECKASRRLGKQIRGLSRFLSKSHPVVGFCQPTATFPKRAKPLSAPHNPYNSPFP